MTRGLVVVLGKTGRNFAAGMSGGVAYVLDEDGSFASRCNPGMVELGPVNAQDELKQLHALIVRHQQYTESEVARRILDKWDEYIRKFVQEYCRLSIGWCSSGSISTWIPTSHGWRQFSRVSNRLTNQN